MTISIITLWLFIVIFYTIIGTWKLFEKAGRKKWEAFVPVYNLFIWLKIAKKPLWWVVLLFIPCLGQLVMLGIVNVAMGRVFGQKGLLNVLLQIFIPFLYFPVIGYNKSVIYIPNTNEKKGKKKIFIFEIMIIVLTFLSILRTYVFDVFTIPTPSMKNELKLGDIVYSNKLAYGLKIPVTPYTIPFFHNTLPYSNIKTYSSLISLSGFNSSDGIGIKRNDIVVFNFPVGDTAVLGRFPGAIGKGGDLKGHNYYNFVRTEAYQTSLKQMVSKNNFFNNKAFFEQEGRNNILNKNILYDAPTEGYITRPIDKKEYYITRCVGLPGDTLEIINGKLIINNKENIASKHVLFNYYVSFNRPLTNKEIEQFSINYGFSLNNFLDIRAVNNPNILPTSNRCIINTSEIIKSKLTRDIVSKKYGNLELINFTKKIDSTINKVSSYLYIYPNHENFTWNADNFGPLWIPKKGDKIKLTLNNWIKYKRCITVYDNNKDVKLKKDGIYIEGKKADFYTFKQNYYFMMGDNRHNSADSRMWGFVPQDHVCGKGYSFSKD